MKFAPYIIVSEASTEIRFVLLTLESDHFQMTEVITTLLLSNWEKMDVKRTLANGEGQQFD